MRLYNDIIHKKIEKKKDLLNKPTPATRPAIEKHIQNLLEGMCLVHIRKLCSPSGGVIEGHSAIQDLYIQT